MTNYEFHEMKKINCNQFNQKNFFLKETTSNDKFIYLKYKIFREEHTGH